MSRPKKVILCVDPDEVALSMRKFWLETRGLRVVTANSAGQARGIMAEAEMNSINLLLCVLQLDDTSEGATGADDLVLLAKRLHPEIATLLLSRFESKLPLETHADVLLPKAACIPAEIYERIRVLLVRKRGPKPVRIPVVADAMRRLG